MMCWAGTGGWGAWAGIAAAIAVSWGLAASAVLAGLRWATRRSAYDGVERLIAERAARGDLTPEEYEALRRVLRS